ncbi:alpha/beta hydrolase-fold protein [Myxococcus stipitatus]|uniref:alpha/beta hydrolase-fold protein n=1 Tax=Myxococcus stipitatus TaxID=83455 RepID=UPI0030D333BC
MHETETTQHSQRGPHRWTTLHRRRFVQFIVANFRVDPKRVYLTGSSMGGWGAWRNASLPWLDPPVRVTSSGAS